eukprot:TRINITY_DN2845_c0_g1_i6.p1 TRINITY_DN2845_c0_g1~~TRINITY_DN2845_c0_g1_i6.p1  ORF type:complete len:1193 (+),score=235.88 TRINITY_DN2845_c0_g1_i6:52-3630(+)
MLRPFTVAAVLAAVGGQNIVEHGTGALPLIITVPHGGDVDLGWPTRDGGGDLKTWGPESNVFATAVAIIDSLTSRCSAEGRVVAMRLHRSHVDANRAPNDCCVVGGANSADAVGAYDEFHNSASSFLSGWNGQKRLLIDLHGMASGRRTPPRPEIGMDATASQLSTYPTPPSTTSLDALGSPTEMLWGSDSLGKFMDDEFASSPPGVGTVPSPSNPTPTQANGGTEFFSGGYTSRKVADAAGGVAALQLELPFELHTTWAPAYHAPSIARALARFMQRWGLATCDTSPISAHHVGSPISDDGLSGRMPAGKTCFRKYTVTGCPQGCTLVRLRVMFDVATSQSDVRGAVFGDGGSMIAQTAAAPIPAPQMGAAGVWVDLPFTSGSVADGDYWLSVQGSAEPKARWDDEPQNPSYCRTDAWADGIDTPAAPATYSVRSWSGKTKGHRTTLDLLPAQPPTASPSASPAAAASPSRSPSSNPASSAPTAAPLTAAPSAAPSASPASSAPSASPLSSAPSTAPTDAPVGIPGTPSASPVSSSPSAAPVSSAPSSAPTGAPASSAPSAAPASSAPTASPAAAGTPSAAPVSSAPSAAPASSAPTAGPAPAPSATPVDSPTAAPAGTPSAAPASSAPSAAPASSAPTAGPAQVPSAAPVDSPTAAPFTAGTPSAAPASSAPSVAPATSAPTANPAAAGTPSAAPVSSPSAAPASSAPTAEPAPAPTAAPVDSPTAAPFSVGTPSAAPASSAPSAAPATSVPSAAPSAPPASGTAAPASVFDECTQVADPCLAGAWASGGSPQCVDPNPTAASTGDYVCSCTNGVQAQTIGGPAVCRINECHPVNPCGDDQICTDLNNDSSKLFDYVCTCLSAPPGAISPPREIGTRARCGVDECAAQPCGQGQTCADPNRTARSSSQTSVAEGWQDFTCECPDGTTQTGGPAVCGVSTMCGSAPCGAGQSCVEAGTNTFICKCLLPAYGSAAVNQPADCRYDECRGGSLASCGAGQMCSDTDTSTNDTWNCTCLPPFNGTKRGAPALCFHDDCREQPCGEAQTCTDHDPSRGRFSCTCADGWLTYNRPADCDFDECVAADCGSGKACTDSTLGFLNIDGVVCHPTAAAPAPSSGSDSGSDARTVAIVAAAVGGAVLAAAGIGLVLRRARKQRQPGVTFERVSTGGLVAMGPIASDGTVSPRAAYTVHRI